MIDWGAAEGASATHNGALNAQAKGLTTAANVLHL